MTDTLKADQTSQAPWWQHAAVRWRQWRLLRRWALSGGNRQDAQALIVLGDDARRVGRTEDAVQLYWTAARWYGAQGEFALAERPLRRTVTLRPNDFPYRWALAECLDRCFEAREAARQYRTASGLARLSHPEEAARLRARAEALDPSDILPPVPAKTAPVLPAPQIQFPARETEVVIEEEPSELMMLPEQNDVSTELALDAEAWISGGALDSAATTRCSPVEIEALNGVRNVRRRRDAEILGLYNPLLFKAS